MDMWGDLFSQPLKGGAPLRVAIVLPRSLRVSHWRRSVIEELQASHVAKVGLVLLVHVDPDVTATRAETPQPPTRGWAWRVYRALDAKRAAVDPDPCEMSDVSDLVGTLPYVLVEQSGPQGGTVDNDVLDRIARAGLDVIVDLDGTPVPASIGALTREGVWAYRGAGDDRAEFEMLSGPSAVTHISLVQRTDAKHVGRTLATATFARDAGSLARFRSHAYFGVTHLVVAELRRLHGATGPMPGGTELGPDPAPSTETPASVDVIRWLAPLALGKIANRVSSTVRGLVQQWQIGYRLRTEGSAPSREGPDLGSFDWVASPAGHFYADPFLLERDGRTWLFVEDYSYDTKRGTIAVAEVGEHGLLSPFTEVISSKGHLSYPYVFEADGEVFMIPESAAEGQVRLYRARSFPYQWEVVTVLHEGRAVDTSVVHHEGRWWFFTTLLEPRGRAAMLMLFSADTLTGSWVSHPMNPVSRDVRNIRGAGIIRPIEGRLVRPSQDCSHSYGYALSWMGVDALDEHTYQERSIGRMEASPRLGMTATHTYNATSRWETVDGRFTRADRSVR